MVAKSKASGKLLMCENNIRPVPKISKVPNSIFFKSIPSLSDARNMAPPMAPSPMKLFRYPKVEACPLNMTLAYTGSKVIKGSEIRLMQPSNKITYPIPGVCFRYVQPSLNTPKTYLECFCLTNSGRRINRRDAITATKLSAFSAKQNPAPNFSSTIPEAAGPISLARFTMDEFSAMAFGKSWTAPPQHRRAPHAVCRWSEIL